MLVSDHAYMHDAAECEDDVAAVENSTVGAALGQDDLGQASYEQDG